MQLPSISPFNYVEEIVLLVQIRSATGTDQLTIHVMLTTLSYSPTHPVLHPTTNQAIWKLFLEINHIHSGWNHYKLLLQSSAYKYEKINKNLLITYIMIIIQFIFWRQYEAHERQFQTAVALFVVSGSIKKLFCQYLSFLNIFFNRFYPVGKCGVTSTLLIS